jgi:hypothetical protein
MKGHGSKFELKKEEAVLALLTQRNVEEAAKAVGYRCEHSDAVDERA